MHVQGSWSHYLQKIRQETDEYTTTCTSERLVDISSNFEYKG